MNMYQKPGKSEEMGVEVGVGHDVVYFFRHVFTEHILVNFEHNLLATKRECQLFHQQPFVCIKFYYELYNFM